MYILYYIYYIIYIVIIYIIKYIYISYIIYYIYYTIYIIIIYIYIILYILISFDIPSIFPSSSHPPVLETKKIATCDAQRIGPLKRSQAAFFWRSSKESPHSSWGPWDDNLKNRWQQPMDNDNNGYDFNGCFFQWINIIQCFLDRCFF